jgi:hypothetical protein
LGEELCTALNTLCQELKVKVDENIAGTIMEVAAIEYPFYEEDEENSILEIDAEHDWDDHDVDDET